MIQGPGGRTAIPPHAIPALVSTTTASTLAPFLLHLINMVLGIIGLGVIIYGAGLSLYLIAQHYRGETVQDYHQQWHATPHTPPFPPVTQALLMIGIGFVVVGFVLSGLWVEVINAMIAIGQHIDLQITQHLKGGTS